MTRPPGDGLRRIDITFTPDETLPLPDGPPTPPTRPFLHSSRRFVRSAVLVLGSVLVVRAVLVEPFGVSTGSMAPTLVGVHRAVDCPRCGYPVRVGAPADGANRSRHYAAAHCPNCGQTDLGLEGTPDLAGDRVLVDKVVYDWRPPRRWEAVVFRGPDKPFVKRAVGLPGERVRVRDGDVWVNGTLARKSLAECRALRVPVFDLTYSPAEGWAERWVAEPPGPTEQLPRVDGAELYFPVERSDTVHWLVYRSWLADERREDAIRDRFAYNGARDDGRLAVVHDFFLSCDVQVLRGAGGVIVALTDGLDTITATLPADPFADGAVLEHGGERRTAARVGLKPGRTHRLELAFIDRRALLALDGEQIVAPLDLPPAGERPGVCRPVKIGARGVVATVRNVRLYRDVHYAAAGRHGVREQCSLGPDEYFMLGDNSENSEDSRFWPSPGVPAGRIMGKPLAIYQPRIRVGWVR